MLGDKLRDWFKEAPRNSTFSEKSKGNYLFSLHSNIGLKRAENQDRTAALYVNPGRSAQNSFYCFVLCDGMGGMKDGSMAASLAISAFLEAMIVHRTEPEERRLLESATAANLAVSKSHSGGSTLSAIMFTKENAYSLNVGDSRVYSRAPQGRVERHTKDDNLKEVAGGSDAALIQYIGIGEGLRPHIQRLPYHFDFIFLTSDGVHSLEKNVFNGIVQNANSTSELCERLITTANWVGGHDNASVVGVSSAALEKLFEAPNGADISIWNSRSEMKIVWADHLPERPDTTGDRDQLNRLRAADTQNVEDVDLIDDEEFKNKKKSRGAKRSPKQERGPSQQKQKDIFGDFG